MTVLLDGRATGLVMSSKFVKRQGFKLKKINKPIYIRNVDGTFNKKIFVEVNIYYQEYREKTEIDVISGQKWSIILEIL